jgi:hypothetical protein
MAIRDQHIADLTSYLQEHFPDADISARKDGLTANEVFTIREGTTARHVEVTKQWLEGNAAAVPLPRAIREWRLAEEVRRLNPNATVRLGPTGFERVD